MARTSAERPVILWLREDLRTRDNPALTAAAATGRPILPVWILDDDAAGCWTAGGASRWWIARSLDALDLPVLRRQGDSRSILDELIDQSGADAVFWSRRYAPWAMRQDKAIKAHLQARGVEARSLAGRCVHEPFAIAQESGAPYKVYTPYSRAWMKRERQQAALPRPAGLRFLDMRAASDDLRLMPTAPDWSGGMASCWKPGEDEAERLLQAFCDEALEGYTKARDVPAEPGTSRLSPYLAQGVISPRRVLEAVTALAPERAWPFIRQIIWRDFAHHSLYHFPEMPERSLRAAFEDYPWSSDAAMLRAWQRGLTGYPIVDAGMRELWHSGWMHNRVRMIAGSFLVKDLGIHWRCGERWFWDTLIDADLANNAMGWQWVAGTGIDAAPYFRIFNPRRQAETFDPDGAYVRRWLPELAALPSAHIQAPHLAPGELLERAGVRLDQTYPRPVVDHAQARQRALAGYAQIKGRA